MADIQPPGWLRTWVATLVTSTSMFASFGLSVGGLLSLVAPLFGANPWAWFFAGTCIPPGVMALIYTTDWMFERRLDTLKRWRDEGKITPERYEIEVDRALEWRSERLYGIPSKPSARAKVRPRPKKVELPEVPDPEPIVPSAE